MGKSFLNDNVLHLIKISSGTHEITYNVDNYKVFIIHNAKYNTCDVYVNKNDKIIFNKHIESGRDKEYLVYDNSCIENHITGTIRDYIYNSSDYKVIKPSIYSKTSNLVYKELKNGLFLSNRGLDYIDAYYDPGIDEAGIIISKKIKYKIDNPEKCSKSQILNIVKEYNNKIKTIYEKIKTMLDEEELIILDNTKDKLKEVLNTLLKITLDSNDLTTLLNHVKNIKKAYSEYKVFDEKNSEINLYIKNTKKVLNQIIKLSLDPNNNYKDPKSLKKVNDSNTKKKQ